MEKLKLSKNMRARTDSIFSEFLLRVGNDDEPTVADDLIALPTSILIKNQSDDLPEDCLINAIFPYLDENFKSIDYIKDRAILATKNEYVDMLNDRIIKQFPSEEKEFYSFDEAVDDTNHHYQPEFLNTLLPNGLPPHKLVLKKYCPIILLRNLDPTNGLCNGTRMHIQISQLKKFQKEWIILRSAEATYKNVKGSEKILKLIVADAKGNKIQAVMYGETIEKFIDMLQKN
ncbi:uncharacterized protein LOC109842040 [Asparagus officinalis]|uniref:uncharacterized protein LOC109842040 n=1 Tax=Asparagus officinalis TaxID=4686 RepID=UPI00098E0DA4|nr:uncharacterized protein LOC109842040 [Asparagus officinalis]